MEPRTILIADRHTHVVNALMQRLRSAGFLVATANDGAEALSLAIALQPDAILVDYQMPGLSGPELCVFLARDAATRNIPVVLLAPEGVDASSVAATSNNVACVLEKPLQPQVVLKTVQGLLVEHVIV